MFKNTYKLNPILILLEMDGHFIHAGPLEGIGVSIYLSPRNNDVRPILRRMMLRDFGIQESQLLLNCGRQYSCVF